MRFPNPLSSLRLLAISSVAMLATTGLSNAEVRPNAECKNCVLLVPNPWTGDSDVQWTVIKEVCELTKGYQNVFPGVPVSSVAGTQECTNCPTVDGEPCDPDDPEGPPFECTIAISSPITIQASLDITATGGVNVGIFTDEFEAKVGFTTSHLTTVACSGQYNTPYCKKVTIKGSYDQLVGKIDKVTASYTKTITKKGNPQGYILDEHYLCDGGSATLTYDSNVFNTEISIDSVNSCGDGG